MSRNYSLNISAAQAAAEGQRCWVGAHWGGCGVGGRGAGRFWSRVPWCVCRDSAAHGQSVCPSQV